MIVGTGIDIIEVPRIATAIERHGRRFIERLFTPAEIAYCESKRNAIERFAARFAAKEAGSKAIGTGWHGGVAWTHIEVQRQPGGKPLLVYHARAREFFEQLGARHAHISITHTEQYAAAFVVLES